jgi:cytochrome c553
MGIGRKIGIGAGVVVAALAGLVGYAAATATSKLQFPDTPAPALAASKDPGVIERGRYLVHGPAHCASCHSVNDRAHPEKLLSNPPLQGGLEFAMGPLGTRYGRNLTSDSETGIGAISDASIARTLRTGVAHDGEVSFFMRFSASALSDDDIVAVISYLRSLSPVKNQVPRGSWGLLGKVLLTYAMTVEPRAEPPVAHVAPSAEPTVERGRYLADQVALCTFCHSKIDMSTIAVTGPKAGGSDPDPSHGEDEGMEFVAPNLTSHPTGMTGKLDEDAFVKRLKGGRAHASSIMPWEGFAQTTEVDLRSIYRYLQTLPKVDHDVGPTYRNEGWKRE